MQFEKKFGCYYSTDGEFKITVSNGRIKGLHPKYCIIKRSAIEIKKASTLAEAKEIAKSWN